MTITRIELDASGNLIAQAVIGQAATRQAAQEIIDARDDSEDENVRYLVM